MTGRRLKYAAYHEAGHAVLADYFDILLAVTLEPRPVTKFRHVNENLSCAVQYAGVLAQARYQRRSIALLTLTGGAEDQRFIVAEARHMAALTGQSEEEIRKKWRGMAANVVSARWSAVGAVAESLVINGRLSAQSVRKLVEGDRL
jgi:hypothetical protein